MIRPRPDESGFSSGIGLVAMAVGLLLVAVFLLFSMNVFSGGSGTGSNHSILSQAPAQSQLKLCAEGRDSSYGSPPTPAQQASCLRQLAGEISGAGP